MTTQVHTQEYIKVLNQLSKIQYSGNTVIGITTDAGDVIESFITTLEDKLVEGVRDLLKSKGVSEYFKVRVRDLEQVVRSILTGELVIHAVSQGTRAVALTHADRATDLVFDMRIPDGFTGRAALYLTAVLEYLTAELLELADNAARDSQTTTITMRHIYRAIINDEELNLLMKTIGFTIQDE